MAWASTQPGWVIGFLDEVWWSRFALPSLNVWQSTDEPVHLVEQVWQKNDPDPKAFACYRVLWQHGSVTSPVRHQISLRFVDGCPISAIATQCAASGSALDCKSKASEAGSCSGILPAFHYSKQVRTWIREQRGAHSALFSADEKSVAQPNRAESWVHAKKVVVEPDGLLSAKLLTERICAHFDCSYEPPL